MHRQIFFDNCGEKKESRVDLNAQYPSSGSAGIRFSTASTKLAEAKLPRVSVKKHIANEKIFASGPARLIIASEKYEVFVSARFITAPKGLIVISEIFPLHKYIAAICEIS
ncbi:MAG: hypothetical protein E7633_10545 [Ruminococcaceae bacterium]|nr:hypothetical protein [Oscillospiraceae bacterium]